MSEMRPLITAGPIGRNRRSASSAESGTPVSRLLPVAAARCCAWAGEAIDTPARAATTRVVERSRCTGDPADLEWKGLDCPTTYGGHLQGKRTCTGTCTFTCTCTGPLSFPPLVLTLLLILLLHPPRPPIGRRGRTR